MEPPAPPVSFELAKVERPFLEGEAAKPERGAERESLWAKPPRPENPWRLEDCPPARAPANAGARSATDNTKIVFFMVFPGLETLSALDSARV